MSVPAYSLPSTVFPIYSLRPAKHGTLRFLGGTVFLLSLLIPYRALGGSSAVSPSGADNANGLISIIVTPANLSIAPGETQQFTATGYFRGGGRQNLTALVVWASSAPGVATIKARGLANSVSPGSTTITAAYMTFTPQGVAKGVTPGTPIINSPPMSAIGGSATLTVMAPLSITTTSLPNGTVATAYSQNILTNGGTLPITWSVPANTLPPGLTLQGNASGVGVVSGTPTAYGSYTFTVTATDSSSPQQSVNRQLTIVINNPPLSIITTSLPNGTVNTAYSEPLQASGGTPPYTWTVASGSTLPSWLTLSGSGTSWTLSGTPTTAAASNFSLTVTDSSVPPQSKTVALTLTVVSPTACGTGKESVLKGQFAFWIEGYTADGFLGTVGSFTADGNGNITAGYVDDNGAQIDGNGQGVQSGSVTPTGSSYSVGSDNRGCATIVTPFYTFVTRFAISPNPAGAVQGTIEEFEPPAKYYVGTGQIFQQQVPAAVPTGNWVNYQMGEDPYGRSTHANRSQRLRQRRRDNRRI